MASHNTILLLLVSACDGTLGDGIGGGGGGVVVVGVGDGGLADADADSGLADAADDGGNVADASSPALGKLVIELGGDTWGGIWSFPGSLPSDTLPCTVVGTTCTITFPSTSWHVHLNAVTLSSFAGWSLPGCNSNPYCYFEGSGEVATSVAFFKLPGEVYTRPASSLAPAVDGDPTVKWVTGNTVHKSDVVALPQGGTATFAEELDPEVADYIWRVDIRNAAAALLGNVTLDGRYHYVTNVSDDGCACVSSSGHSAASLTCSRLQVGATSSLQDRTTSSPDFVNGLVAVKSCSRTAWAFDLRHSQPGETTPVLFAETTIGNQANTKIGALGIQSVGAGLTYRAAVIRMGSYSGTVNVVTVRP